MPTTFKKYPKVHRLGKEEVEGILEGTVHIEEKIDGANTSIWLDKHGEITCGSRNRELTEGFNGFVEWVRNSEAVRNFFVENPTLRLYGEWLVRHTLAYKETNYKKFYLFDMSKVSEGEEVEEFLDRGTVRFVGMKYGFNMPFYHGAFTNVDIETLMLLVGKSELGDVGEGIVIKNETFRDKFGSHNYAKIVSESFKEDNGVTFGGNNKHSDTYNEMYIVNKCMTLARIEKVMNKIQPLIEERLDLKHIPRVTNTAYHDMLTEEIWEIQGKVSGAVDFGVLKRVANKKAIQICKDIITGGISVADRNN